MVPFCIIRAWNGASEKLDKKTRYFDTMSVEDRAARVRKCTLQDKRVLETMRTLGEVSASDLERVMPDPIVSIRRSINTLMNGGHIRRAGSKMSPLGHPERTYVVC